MQTIGGDNESDLLYARPADPEDNIHSIIFDDTGRLIAHACALVCGRYVFVLLLLTHHRTSRIDFDW